jgi:hypothetical protein
MNESNSSSVIDVFRGRKSGSRLPDRDNFIAKPLGRLEEACCGFRLKDSAPQHSQKGQSGRMESLDHLRRLAPVMVIVAGAITAV